MMKRIGCRPPYWDMQAITIPNCTSNDQLERFGKKKYFLACNLPKTILWSYFSSRANINKIVWSEKVTVQGAHSKLAWRTILHLYGNKTISFQYILAIFSDIVHGYIFCNIIKYISLHHILDLEAGPPTGLWHWVLWENPYNLHNLCLLEGRRALLTSPSQMLYT